VSRTTSLHWRMNLYILCSYYVLKKDEIQWQFLVEILKSAYINKMKGKQYQTIGFIHHNSLFFPYGLLLNRLNEFYRMTYYIITLYICQILSHALGEITENIFFYITEFRIQLYIYNNRCTVDVVVENQTDIHKSM
jgi:hypothetical protein